MIRRNSSVEARLTKARTALLLDHPFFGSLLFRLKIECHAGVSTMATDGTTVFYNPGFVDSLSTAELVGVLAYEVMHPALQHHTRRGDREARRWNMAADYAINPLLVDAGLTLPADALRDDRFQNMSAERIYNLLADDVGGGGTDFRPVFAYLEEQAIMPQSLIFLTDLCGQFPEEGPNYPVIWAATTTAQAPFGETIPMSAA